MSAHQDKITLWDAIMYYKKVVAYIVQKHGPFSKEFTEINFLWDTFSKELCKHHPLGVIGAILQSVDKNTNTDVYITTPDKTILKKEPNDAFYNIQIWVTENLPEFGVVHKKTLH